MAKSKIGAFTGKSRAGTHHIAYGRLKPLNAKWFQLCLPLALLGWLGCAAISGQPPGREAKQLNLKEGETAAVSGTDLTVEARKISDLTAEGCLGGPVGCPDQAQLKVTRGRESREIVLYVAHSQSQREQGVNEADIFGYKILLTRLKGKQITLNIKASR